MEVYQGVAMTDGLNRKNHFIPLSTILKAYRDTWDRTIPMNIGHDRTKPIGYTRLTGVYMEPGKAYVTNEGAIMETTEEHEMLRKMIEVNDYQQFCEAHRDEIDSLVGKLKDVITDSFRVAPIGQAIYDLCNAWNKNGDNRLLSVGIMLNEHDEAVQLSFAGHVSDYVSTLKDSLEERKDTFNDLVERLYTENNNFGNAGDRPNKFTLIYGDVVCFDRYVVHPKYISGTRWEGKEEIVELAVSKEEASYLKDNKIICAPIKWVKNSKCTKCGADYLRCKCVKFIDEDVSENHIEYEQIGMTWTNRSAYYPEGELLLD